VIIAVAQGLEDERTERWLLDCLGAKSDLVVRNAIEGLVARRSKAAIPALIDKLAGLGGKRSTISYAVLDALVALTGREFDLIEDWRKFWEMNGAGLDPKALDDDDESTGVARRQRAAAREPEFFGVEVVSQKVMFVIDTSGSMLMYDEGGDAAGSGEPVHQRRQRMRRVREQLSEAVRRLPGGSRFNIVSFDDKVLTFHEKGIVPANPDWKKKAIGYIERLQANGATHTDDALRAAFRERSIDTIFLLTDGAPAREDSEGIDLRGRIVEEVRQLNRIRKVKIYTFGFNGPGTPPPGMQLRGRQDPDSYVAFLKQLAEENGGTFTAIQ
jgi:hypothetical protein